MLKIRRTLDGAAIVLNVIGRLDAGNVSELCVSLDVKGARDLGDSNHCPEFRHWWYSAAVG
jgi:hypothetical protein